jgi:hypothetical protein
VPGQQTRPVQGHVIGCGLGLALDEGGLACLGHRRDHVREQRAVNGLTHGEGDVAAACDLDRLVAFRQRQIAIATAIGVSADLFEVEVADIWAKVGEAPGNALVVPDHDAGQAGEGEAGDVKGAFGRDAATVQTGLVPDAGDTDTKVRIVGQQRFSGR